jgi:hypothetical protein
MPQLDYTIFSFSLFIFVVFYISQYLLFISFGLVKILLNNFILKFITYPLSFLLIIFNFINFEELINLNILNINLEK